ncbi:MAG: sulfite reductase [Candidatus Aminicenantes bacterium]|jgi:ferredoxin|nr:MAG: sulfite reductase [Candidatus Aminicenantes bacterium]
MEKVLSKKAFPQWVKKLESYAIYSPRKDGDFWNYEVIKNSEIIDLDYLNTVLSPKKIIFPQREVLLEFSTSNEEELKVNEVLPEETPSVIFGVRPCDAKALTLTDKVFGGDFKDPYYWKRRNSTALVGLACNTPPSPNCFCLSVDGSPHSKEGLDILMTDLGDKYYAESFTKKGDELLNLARPLFKNPIAKEKKELEKIQAESKKRIKRQIKAADKIPAKLKKMFNSSFWDEESLSCLRCGICTYLCPTCHCFDMNDEVTSSSPIKGERVRTWDNCQFPDFTMHSSGHNPRPDKAARLRQRILHKFQYFVELYKNYQCTGCGRCISKCPVGIDIIEVLEKARDYGS